MKTFEYIAAVVVVFGTLLSVNNALADDIESTASILTSGEIS